MSIITDIFLWLLIDTALGFLLYSTGCFILKALTFGQYEIKYKDFTSFKANKSKKINLALLLGFSFYVALIFFIAYLNN